MPSLAEMVEETVGLLNDWTGQQPQQTSLANLITDSALSFIVDDGQTLSRGLAELDDELVYVSVVDQEGGVATIPPWGRGQQGSVAASHAAGARVTTTPRPPRHRVKYRINQVIRALYPDLWTVAVDEQTADTREEYPLPATARWVIDVRWQTPGSPVTWEKVRGWRLNTKANLTTFPTGVALTVGDVPSGQKFRTLYAGEPTALAAAGDDFATVSGLHEGAADLVVMAAASQLVLGQELSRGQLATLEQQQRAVLITTGASMAASRFLKQEYAGRVAAERRRLLASYPSRPHFEGV